MSDYKFQMEVREKAEEYVQALLRSGYSARLLEDTFRDYCVKVLVEKSGVFLGQVVVYYRPSQKKCVLKTHELKRLDSAPEIERVWLEQESSPAPMPDDRVVAYVDGSFIDETIGYGAVILQGDRVVQEFSGRLGPASQSLISMRHVAGEIQAVYEVLGWASANSVSTIDLFFDYEGLEFWANGAWKANNPHVVEYQAFASNCPVKIVWHKVKGHSGDYWNDRADQLARQGAQNNKSEGAQAPVEMLVARSRAFVAFLASSGIPCHFDRVYNDMYSRLIFSGANGTNILDIYETRKQHLAPKWHGFSDNALREQVILYWQAFSSSNDVKHSGSSPRESLAQTVEQYLEVLRPYKHLDFDFVELAGLVMRLGSDKVQGETSIEELRHDFDLIEKTYLELSGEEHG